MARALGLRFVAGAMPAVGRAVDADGDPALGERPVAAVITRCLATRLFGDPRAAVGARLTSSRIADVPVTGVVEDVTMRMALMPYPQLHGVPVRRRARSITRRG